MDVSSFYTTSVFSDRKDTTVNASAGKNPLPGQNFLDFILAQINSQKTEDELLAQNNTTLDANPDLAALLDANVELREEIKAMLDPNSQLAQALALNQEAIDAALSTVNDGLITTASVQAGSPQLMQALMIETEGQTNPDISAALEKLHAILTKLEALAKKGEAGLLTLTNLTPEEITDIKVKIEALLNKEVDEALTEEQKRKALDGIYLGLIKLVSPPEQTTASATLQAAANKAQNDNANKINDLTRPAPKTNGEVDTQSEWVKKGATEGTETNKFAAVLKDFSGKKPALQADIALKTAGVKPDLSTLQGWPFNVSSSIFAPINWSAVPYETIGGQSPAMTVTSLGSLTNLVTQAHSASAPHPAMQTVAATISKAAANGETKNIILQLDPPELGRVEVRMSFGKDKTVKAVLLAEKPETLHMLQRDSHSLERILLDSGLSVDGGGIDFSLAQEGYDFNQQGGDGSNKSASKDGAPEEIIESTMTWRVDPETGHMRYSVLV